MNNRKLIIIGIIILIIIITILIIYFNKSDIVHNILIKDAVHMETDFLHIISPDKLPPSKIGKKYTYSLWLYSPNIPENAHWNNKFNIKKFILYRYGSPNIVFHPHNNLITISHTFKTELGTFGRYHHEITNLTNQKWNHFSIVLNNREFSVYINGKLNYSTILENVPFVFQRFLFIGEKQNNFNGYLCNLEYFNDSLSSNDILDIYNSQKNKLDNNVEKYSRTYYLRRIKQLEEEKKRTELNEKIKFAF